MTVVLKLYIGVILSAHCVEAQTWQELLLPDPLTIQGVVTDPDGIAIPGVRIDHTDDRQHSHETDPAGQFRLQTAAPALVFRKSGYQSEWVRTQGGPEMKITLHKLSQSGGLPACSTTGRYERLEGWGASFQFLKAPGVKASPQSHGSGPAWGIGIPLDPDVWRSVSYAEVTFQSANVTVIDARGQFANGNRWRSLGKLGESAGYSDVEPSTAEILDRFLEGACLIPGPAAWEAFSRIKPKH